MRVRVIGYDGEKLGLGTVIDHVTIHAVQLPDGEYESAESPEDELAEGYAELVGGKPVKLESVPKIRLDNGQIVYGCQVYLKPVNDEFTIQRN